MRILLIAALLASALPVAAKTPEWTDLQGTTFKGEPLEILGPYALFRTSFGGGKRVLLRGFSTESIQRFWQEAKNRDPALRWSEAHADATEDVVGQQSRFNDDVLPVHLKKGENRILIKIQNMVGEWSFICRLRTRGH